MCSLWKRRAPEHGSGGTGPWTRGHQRRQSRGSSISPWGQAEAGRAQDSEDSPAAEHPQTQQISAPKPVPRSIWASVDWETAVSDSQRADSRARNLAMGIFFSSFYFAPGRGRTTREQNLARDGASPPRHRHLRIRCNRPLPHNNCQKNKGKASLLNKQHWKAPGLRENSI